MTSSLVQKPKHCLQKEAYTAEAINDDDSMPQDIRADVLSQPYRKEAVDRQNEVEEHKVAKQKHIKKLMPLSMS